MDPHELIEPVHAVCRAAGHAILPIYAAHRQNGAQVQHKGDGSPLTAADQASHAVIEAGLQERFPGVPVVSEEGRIEALGAARHWLVDPLDGTKEFLKANGQFTVNVALVEHGRPLFGLVVAPVTGVAYAGAPGTGAWRHALDTWTPMAAEPLRGATCRAVVSRSHKDPRTDAFIAAIQRRGLDVQQTSVGSSLKLCMVAEGAAHVYPRLAPTMHWDTAAAHAVVEGAGGTVTDLHGQPLRYGHGDLRNPSFIAAAPAPFPWHELVPPVQKASG